MNDREDQSKNRIRLLPPSWRDRLIAFGGVAGGLFSVFLFGIAYDLMGYGLAAFAGFYAVISFLLAYAFQDQPEEADEYARMVRQLDEAREALKNLSGFLERERVRVSEAEKTLSRLQAEREALQPVVETQREVVEAILKTHAATIRTKIWKDRLFGFALGLLSSLIAGGVLYVLGVGR